MRRIIICVTVFVLVLISFPQRICAVSARGFAVINGDTGKLIYSSNANERLPMASTTKIMTALLLCKSGKLNKKITVTKEMITVEGSSMGLMPGDVLTGYDLLYGMMLPSGNDAANVTAYAVSGSIDKFVKLMNGTAAAMGLCNTHFDTPSGLDGETHYTTAYELALITKAAFMYKEFKEAVGCRSKILTLQNAERKIYLSNHNRLLKTYDDVTGVKTGFTKKSGRCLVSSAERDGNFVIAVTLNDGNDWLDHRNLLDIGLNSVKETQIKANEYCFDVRGSDKLQVKAKSDGFKIGLCKDENISYEVTLNGMLSAPIRRKDILGTVTYKADGKTVKVLNITALEDVKPLKIKFITKFIYNFKFLLSKV